MGREFTNALASIPLWQFALQHYPDLKTELLYWQDEHHASVNDLLTLAFAQKHQLHLPNNWWQATDQLQIRQLIKQVRSQRRNLEPPLYKAALDFELELEGLDMLLLWQQLRSNLNPTNISDYAEFLSVQTHQLASLVNSIAVKAKLISSRQMAKRPS